MTENGLPDELSSSRWCFTPRTHRRVSRITRGGDRHDFVGASLRVRPVFNLDRWVFALKRSNTICACLHPTRRSFEPIMGDVGTLPNQPIRAPVQSADRADTKASPYTPHPYRPLRYDVRVAKAMSVSACGSGLGDWVRLCHLRG